MNNDINDSTYEFSLTVLTLEGMVTYSFSLDIYKN